MEKVLMVTEAYGGGIKTHFDLISKYKHEFYDYEILFYVSEKRLEANQSNSLTDCIVNNELSNFKSISSFIKNLRELNRIINENQIDIVHSHSTLAGLLCKIYKAVYGRKLKFVYTPHGYYSQGTHSPLKKCIIVLIERFIEKKVQTIHVSRGENTHANLNKISDSSRVIFNGTEIPKLENNKSSKKNKEFVNIGYLARAEEPKNVERFIEIAHTFRLKYSNKNVRFIFGGSGKNISFIEKMVNEKRKNSNIQLIGTVEKEEFFNQIDLYMSTSKYEGLPFSVIEAMSYKKPLFLSEIKGHLDFRQSEATRLFNLNESDSNIVEQINEFICNKDFPRYKNDIYDEFLNSFSVSDMVFKIKKLYDSL